MEILSKKKVGEILDILDATYPEAECALNYNNIYELIVAVALSAQTTDVGVNKATPRLFEKYSSPELLAEAEPKEVEVYIKTLGMYKQKAKNLVKMAKQLVSEFNGQVPKKYEQLITLPGVGRKTANVVLSVGFGEPRIAVDTHVFRLANRIGIVKEKDVLKTEMVLMERIPKKRWSRAHHSLIFHGRNRCIARKPQCEKCEIKNLCKKVLK